MEPIEFKNFEKEYKKNVDKYNSPMLLIEKILDSEDKEVTFKTSNYDRTNVLAVKNGKKIGQKPIEKSFIFNFEEFVSKSSIVGISVGRTPTNKISLMSNSVSKMHAIFRKKGEQWNITDTGSENGTKINGEIITANKSMDINNGDGITFADTYHCTFFMPSGFKAYMESIL